MKVLIDFENVNFPGLDGIKGLTKDDEFLIFYNDTARISFDLHRQIEKLDCKKEYQKISSENDNALDFLLSTILGRYIAIDSISSYASKVVSLPEPILHTAGNIAPESTVKMVVRERHSHHKLS